MNPRRTFAATLSGALIAPLLSLGGGSTASAGPSPTSTCFGSPAPGETRNVIIGTNQSETLIGTPGADLIIGRRGRDIIKGLGGDDLICGSEDSDPPDGADLIRAGDGLDVLIGGKGDDEMHGGKDRDNLFGGGGADTLDGGPNQPGVGDDANYFFAAGPIVADLDAGTARGEGRDTLLKIEGLGGSSAGDRLLGNEGDNSFDGLGGDDVMRGRGGVDTLGLTFANNNMFVNMRGGTSVGDGSDIFSKIENVIGSPYNDYITGSGRPNAILGADGKDTIYGRTGDDIILGFGGDDAIFGGAGVADFVPYSDRPDLAVDIDLLAGTAARSDGNDTLAGVEMVSGSSLNDTIAGDHGPNFFYADEGNDTINGNGGSDLIFFLDAPGRVTVDLAEGAAKTFGGDPDSLQDIENVVGSAYDDELRGTAGRNFLNGSDGNDQVNGRGGNDYLAGGAGNDTLTGGPGRNDLVDFFQSRNSLAVFLSGAARAVGEGVDTLNGIEAVSGGPKSDEIAGSARPNALYGAGGRDSIFGFGGDDRLDGGRGVDSLAGGENDDKCFRKSESSTCEQFDRPSAHPVAEVGRRYKKAVAAARRYKRRYK